MNENGCKWRGLPDSFGPWQTFYRRWRRWNDRGVLRKVFQYLHEEVMLRVDSQVVVLDSTSVKIHPDGTGSPKVMAPKPSASPTDVATPKYT